MAALQWKVSFYVPSFSPVFAKINIITFGALLLWIGTSLVTITAATAIPSTKTRSFGDGGGEVNYPIEITVFVNNQSSFLLMRGDHTTWKFDGNERENNFIHNIGVEEGPPGLACFLWAPQKDLYEDNRKTPPFIYGPAYAGSPTTIVNKDFGNYRFLTCLRLPKERNDLVTIWFEVPDALNSSGIVPPPPSPPPIGRAEGYMDDVLLSESPTAQLDSLEHSYNLAFVPLWKPEMSSLQGFVHGAEFFGQTYPVSRAAIIDAPSKDVICRLFYHDESGEMQLKKRLLLPRKQMTKQVDQTEGFYCRGPSLARRP